MLIKHLHTIDGLTRNLIELPAGGVIMTDKQFYVLFCEALNATDKDAFVSDWALSSMWTEDLGQAEDYERDDDSDLTRLAGICGAVWDLAHLSVADIRAHTGLTQAAFATRFCIPLRTVQNWELRDGCPPYVRLMMATLSGMADGIRA